MEISTQVIDWLMSGDSAIRHQVMRDILSEPDIAWKKEQTKVATSGWGSHLLSLQSENGYWGGGLYSPKWISTHYTMMLLMRLGLHQENPQARRACGILLDKGYYSDGGINFFASLKHSETCVTGMVLSLCSYFNLSDSRVEDLVYFLLCQQMKDGGWNCQSFNGDTHSSMHTTISVLEGLSLYECKRSALGTETKSARIKAHEFLLRHRLYKSDKTGKVIDPRMLRIPFPPRWRYDILRVLDYFQGTNTQTDERMIEAIDLIRKKQREAFWPNPTNYPGRVYFNLEEAGKKSRWNTLRVLRVLKWWGNKNF